MAGAPDNLNALSSGRRTERYGLALNRLGERYTSAYHQIRKVRLSLESLRRESLGLPPDGQLPPRDCWLVDGILVQELIIRVARMQLPRDPDPNTVAKLLGSISSAYSHRTSLLSKLGIMAKGDGTAEADPWAALDAEAAQEPRCEPSGQGQAETAGDDKNASESRTDTPEGHSE